MTANDPAATDPGTGPARVCPGCGYDLRGIDGGRCPECGLAQDGADAFVIPWQQRKEVGRLAAFWQTVRFAVVRPRRLAMAMAAPVEAAPAERFRWCVVTLAALPPILFFLAVAWHTGGTRFVGVTDNGLSGFLPSLADPWGEMAIVWSAGATLLPVLPAGLVLTLFLATGVPGYWFRPPHLNVTRQDRAVVISRYACGPLAWLALPVLLAAAVVGLSAGGFLDYQRSPRDLLILAALSGVILAAAWRASLVLLARTTHCTTGRVIAAGVGVPVGWMLSALVGLGALPFAVGLIWVVVDSLR